MGMVPLLHGYSWIGLRHPGEGRLERDTPPRCSGCEFTSHPQPFTSHPAPARPAALNTPRPAELCTLAAAVC